MVSRADELERSMLETLVDAPADDTTALLKIIMPPFVRWLGEDDRYWSAGNDRRFANEIFIPVCCALANMYTVMIGTAIPRRFIDEAAMHDLNIRFFKIIDSISHELVTHIQNSKAEKQAL